MKRIASILFIAFALSLGGSVIAEAKDDVQKEQKEQKEQVVEYSLSPAPVCQNCVNKIKGNLRFEKGVKNIVVDLEKKSVAITYSPKATDEEKLVAALKKIGYTATPYSCENTAEEKHCSNCK